MAAILERLKTWSSRKPQRIFSRGFPTPNFPLCTTPKTENFEMKASDFSQRHSDQTPRFSNSEFSILNGTQNKNSKLKTSEFSLWHYEVVNSAFSILHHTQNGKLRVENLGVFSKVHRNNDFVNEIV